MRWNQEIIIFLENLWENLWTILNSFSPIFFLSLENLTPKDVLGPDSCLFDFPNLNEK